MKTIPLSNTDRLIIVDDEDYERLSKFTWSQSVSKVNRGVVRRSYKHGLLTYTVSIANEIMYTRRVQYDHIDRNPLNNQKHNLRLATDKQNAQNRTKRRNASSKFKGVSWTPKVNRWACYICIDGKQVWLGYHETEDAAARRYNEMALKHFKEFASLNPV